MKKLGRSGESRMPQFEMRLEAKLAVRDLPVSGVYLFLASLEPL